MQPVFLYLKAGKTKMGFYSMEKMEKDLCFLPTEMHFAGKT